MDKESLICVAEDLEYLKDQWGPDIQDPDIRRGSPVLRRLLVEGLYGQAWRAMDFDKQPNVIAVDIYNLVDPENLDDIVCIMAWGAHFRGLVMALPCINKGNKPPELHTPPLRENGYPGERIFSLSEYIESVSGIAQGEVIKRREVIKYVANIKGGVHLSQKRKRAEKTLVKKLERFEKIINVHTSDGIFVEIVSIAQTIGNSDDAIMLSKQIRQKFITK